MNTKEYLCDSPCSLKSPYNQNEIHQIDLAIHSLEKQSISEKFSPPL